MVKSRDENAQPHECSGPAGLSRVSAIFLKYRLSLGRYVARFVRQPQDIEDIVHEAYLRSYSAEIGAEIRAPKAFLFKTAKNLALKHLDRSAYRLLDYVEDLDSLEVIDEPSLEQRVELHEQFLAFCRAVSTLPVQWRKVFILRKVYGLSHQEIASELELSVSTVEKHLASGILRCNQYMRSCGHDRSSASRPRAGSRGKAGNG